MRKKADRRRLPRLKRLLVTSKFFGFFFGKDNPCPCGLVTCDLDETGGGEAFYPWERSMNDGEDAGNEPTSAGELSKSWSIGS